MGKLMNARSRKRPENIRLESWWPRWISIDWGFHHPSAVYWHVKKPALENTAEQVITYRELVQSGLSPRMLGQAIAERTGNERISEIFLSPDAFAHRTSEASIAEQLSDVLVAHGLPRAGAADDERLSGWQWMYQLLEGDEWLISETCEKLIECLPMLVRDEPPHEEDVRKMDGDDPADAARYGLAHLRRQLGTEPLESRVARRMEKTPLVEKICGKCGQEISQCKCEFVTGRPLGEQIETRVKDMTSYAIHAQKLEAEERRRQRSFKPGRRRH